MKILCGRPAHSVYAPGMDVPLLALCPVHTAEVIAAARLRHRNLRMWRAAESATCGKVLRIEADNDSVMGGAVADQVNDYLHPLDHQRPTVAPADDYMAPEPVTDNGEVMEQSDTVTLTQIILIMKYILAFLVVSFSLSVTAGSRIVGEGAISLRDVCRALGVEAVHFVVLRDHFDMAEPVAKFHIRMRLLPTNTAVTKPQLIAVQEWVYAHPEITDPVIARNITIQRCVREWK